MSIVPSLPFKYFSNKSESTGLNPSPSSINIPVVAASIFSAFPFIGIFFNLSFILDRILFLSASVAVSNPIIELSVIL